MVKRAGIEVGEGSVKTVSSTAMGGRGTAFLPGVSLKGLQPVAAGSFRICYPHPGDPTKCIKIAQPRPPTFHTGKTDWLLGRLAQDPNDREWAAYRGLIDAGVPVHDYFPKVHGFVETDLGRGLCVDLVCGIDRTRPVSVADYMHGRQRMAGLSGDIVLEGLKRFAAFCTEHGILGACSEPNNVGLVRTQSGFRFIAYDLKIRRNKEFLPLSTLVPAARRRKVARRFERTILDVERRLRALQSAEPARPSTEPGRFGITRLVHFAARRFCAADSQLLLYAAVGMAAI
jgi:hypothetical protein